MANSVWEMAANTPWWIYVLFIVLVRFGFIATKPRLVPIKALIFLPSILIIFSLLSVYPIVGVNGTNLLIWAGTILAGIAVGWFQYFCWRIKAVKEKQTLYLPGTWGLLITILIIFTLKCYFDFEISLDSASFLNAKYQYWLIMTYGFFTGLFIGRLIYALNCVKYGPFIDSK